MKCEFPPGADVCKRCRSGNHQCVVEGRKPRRAPSKREYLLAQLRQKDGIIESLLKQLHNPYAKQPLTVAAASSATPDADQQRQDVVAWLDQLQSSVRNPVKRHDGSGASVRLSNRDDSDDESAGSGGLALVSEEDAHPTLPDTASPFGFLANIALGNLRQGEPSHRPKRIRADGEPESEPTGVASYDYFVPGPSIDLDRRISLSNKVSAPDLVVHGVIQPNEIGKLFDIFHNRVNLFMGVLDPRIHTPEATYSRCPLLFSTVCAIALRYSDRPSQFPLAMHFAKKAAADALVDGWKSAELAQAYIFLSMYAVPSRKLEEDRSMLYAGLAVRIASDLNVRAAAEKKPRDDEEALEVANHRRLWMACFTLDKQTAAAFGKQSTVREAPVISSASEGFPTAMSDNNPFDIHLAAKSMLMRDLTRFHSEIFSDASTPGALNTGLDLREIVLRYDTEFQRTSDQWIQLFSQGSDKSNPAAAFRCKLLPFYVGSSRLVILSFMLQQAFKRGLQTSDEVFFKKSLDVARNVLTIMLELIAPTGYLRYAPDCYFIYSTFAAAYLLKLLRQECKPFIREGREREIYQSIERLIDLFNSPKVAIDHEHTPRLYAEFLSKLLSKHRKDINRSRASSPQSHPSPASSTRSYAPHPPPIFTNPLEMAYQQAMPLVPSVSVNGAPYWDGGAPPQHYGDSGYPTPESLHEPLYDPAPAALQMGGNPAYDFTFSAPLPEEEKCAEEERSSIWWNGLVTPSIGWVSEGVQLGMGNGQLPSPYEQPATQNGYMPTTY